MEEKLTYTQAAAKLDELVKRMQDPNCSIDELSHYTSEALSLLKLCKERLTQTDAQLQKVLAELGDNAQA